MFLIVLAILTVIFSIAAAVASQYAYSNGRDGDLPTYFGGEQKTEDVNSDTIQKRGDRECARLKSAFFQLATSALIIAATLVGLSLTLTGISPEIKPLLKIGIWPMGLIWVVWLGYQSWRWWKKDCEIITQTERRIDFER